jgi:MerR family Zn(II)-responsive transcriptional regulator of zntA
MARHSNNTLRTVRFYEEEGILRPVRRTEGGHRLFGKSELERLMLVTDMRAAGLSLDEIKQILAVKESAASGGEASKMATKVLAAKIDELREKLQELTRLQDDLMKTSDVMSVCLECHDPRFPLDCNSCARLQAVPNLPRSMRVLWSTNGRMKGSGGSGESA